MLRRLVLPLSMLFAAGLLPTASMAGVPAKPAANSGVKVLSATATKTGTSVTVRVAWDRALIARPGQNERFTLRLLMHSASGRTLKLAELTRARASAAADRATLRLTSRNAKLLRSARHATVTATQQYDSPSDADQRFEQNRVALRSVAGKAGGLVIKACSVTAITSGADLSGCNLPGAALANADLSGVNLSYANLQGGTLAGAKLVTTDLTGANLIDVSLDKATWPAAEQGALTLPADGNKIVSAIGQARSSVDVVIYDFGGPNIIGQASKPGALMQAVSRGVNVRVMLNSATQDDLCKGLDTAAQANCGWTESLDPLYATQASLKYAQAHPDSGKTAGRVRVQFSSQNFQITHQKTILIDTANADGTPRAAGQMIPTSQALVSTGNLQSFPVDWGRRANCAKGAYDATGKYVCSRYQVLNQGYLTNPAGSCGSTSAPMSGAVTDCLNEWQARDFSIVVHDDQLLERIAAVFGSDQRCDPRTVNNNLINSTLPDTWANGTLLSDGSQYPLMNTDAFYGGGPNASLQGTPQGNARERTLRLIAAAKKTLIVYNEEMDDSAVVAALSAAAAPPRSVDVRVVMATKLDYTTKKPVASYSFDQLVRAGVKVNLITGSAPYPSNPQWVYIHAKAIVADGVDGFMGSENFGYASMNFNRELGLMLTNRADPTTAPIPSLLSVGGIQQIETAFEKDWASPLAQSYAFQDAPPPKPPSGKGYGGFSMACAASGAGSDLYGPELPIRAMPPTRPDQPVQ